jgi:hypothetical protein
MIWIYGYGADSFTAIHKWLGGRNMHVIGRQLSRTETLDRVIRIDLKYISKEGDWPVAIEV